MVGLQNLDATLPAEAQVLKREAGPGFLQLPVAHIERDHLVSVPSHHATVAGHGVVAAPAVPLANLDLKVSGQAAVQHEGARLLVLIAPGVTVEKQISTPAEKDIFPPQKHYWAS